MISFDQYYLEYLGVHAERLKAGHRVFPCERRARSFAFFYAQHLISTAINGDVVFSVAPEFALTFEIQRTLLTDNAVNKDLLRMIVLDQIRTLDKTRLVKKLGFISPETQLEVISVLQRLFAF